jgi:hypothetical protein
MQLHQLVEINEDAIVANAVNFGMMRNRDDNFKLCKGFVFNYDAQQPRASTLGVLDALYWGFHSPSNPNIHLMVQDYGKGKTHFALTVANFFKLTPDHKEVQGIFKQIEYATSSDHEILRNLQTFKNRGRHLVICLSGDQPLGLRQQFLQEVTRILKEEGREDVIASHTCKEPLEFLHGLTSEERQVGEQVLIDEGCDFDLNLLIKLLDQQADYEKIDYVIKICQKVRRVNPNFQTTVDIETIIGDLLANLCSGENRLFQGILIIFDELYKYLERWSERHVDRGDTPLQNITNSCARFRDRVSLLSLSQRLPSRVVPPGDVEDYNHLISRLSSNTYEPAASLELVLKGLINQKQQTTLWQTFEEAYRNTLNRISNDVFDKFSGKYYARWKWQKQDFYQIIGLGCFPLHPLTTYLLCNLNFTQGRTVLDFIQDQDGFREFVDSQPVEKDGKLNYVYPVTLVDAFEGNFSNPQSNPEYPRLFGDYTYAADKVKALSDAEPGELDVLRGLFLFYASASGEKLAKPDREPHEEVLSVLTGIDKQQVKRLLVKLSQERRVINHDLSGRTYSFYSGGIDPNSLEQRITEELANQTPSIIAVKNHCHDNIHKYLGLETLPTSFIEQNQLRREDWRLKNRIFTVDEFRQEIRSINILKDSPLGVVAYVIAETQEQARNLSDDLDLLITSSPVKEQLVVAIAVQPAYSLAILLEKRKLANGKSLAEFGEALIQLKTGYDKVISTQVKELFESCIYHCHLINKLPVEDRTDAARLASALLNERYSLVPPVAGIDKMAVNKGGESNQMIGFIANRLLEDDLRSTLLKPAYENTLKPVFVQAWRLLKLKGQRYEVCEPEHPRVKTAWQYLSSVTELEGSNEKTVAIDKLWKDLSSHPYGYNEYTFTILLAAWLSYHRREVYIRGPFGIPEKRQNPGSRTASVKDWVSAKVFDKAKDFIHKWVLVQKPYIVRHRPLSRPEIPEHLTYEQAQNLLEEISNFLDSTIDASERDRVTDQQQKLQAGVKRLNDQIAPVLKAQSILNTQSLSLSNIEALVRLYPELKQSLSSFSDGNLTVAFSQQQIQQREQTLHQIIESIGRFVEAEAKRHTSLRTPLECENYQDELKRLQKLSKPLEDLPTRLKGLLEQATRAASTKLTELREQESQKNCLTKIRQRVSTLSTNATQVDYRNAQAYISQLVDEVPTVTTLEPYQAIVQELIDKLQTLDQQLDEWEAEFSSSLSKAEAHKLNNQINQQKARFTDNASQARISTLQEDLDRIILEREDTEIEEQMVDLFRRLSRDRRPNLLKRLANEELDKTTEEFDG